MKKINWLKISGIVAVVMLVITSMFSFTLFLRKLPDINTALLLVACFTIIATIASIFYISKTQYGAGFQNGKNENK